MRIRGNETRAEFGPVAKLHTMVFWNGVTPRTSGETF